ncbi:MAG: hypothetical protein MZW92_04870 [Comamonadaceae bacterium]|nr:hypothetical protein [Comamonadaceae bacterium]
MRQLIAAVATLLLLPCIALAQGAARAARRAAEEDPRHASRSRVAYRTDALPFSFEDANKQAGRLHGRPVPQRGRRRSSARSA